VERLAELRESQALTLRDLAERSGVDANTINQVELGHRKPRPSTLRKLARALEVDVEEFYTEPALAEKAEAPREAGQEERAPLWQDDPKRRLSPSTPRPPDFPFDAFEVARAAFAENGADTEEEEVSRELGQMFADALAGWPRQDLRAAYEWADHDVLKALANMPASEAREELMRAQVERFAASAALQALDRGPMLEAIGA